MAQLKGKPKHKSHREEIMSLQKYADLLEEVEGMGKFY